ncbi:MAG: hypothetical protein ACPGAI_03515, partial [Flavobacteriaceae bacterium]
QDEYSFIPTMSALAIETNNWHGTADLSASPFDNIEASTINSSHVSLTQDMADFAITEILQLLGNSDVVTQSWGRVINPAKGNIQMFLDPSFKPAFLEAELFQLDGRRVANTSWHSPAGHLSWPISLSQGLYLLHLNDGNSSHNIRLLVE